MTFTGVYSRIHSKYGVKLRDPRLTPPQASLQYRVCGLNLCLSWSSLVLRLKFAGMVLWVTAMNKQIEDLVRQMAAIYATKAPHQLNNLAELASRTCGWCN